MTNLKPPDSKRQWVLDALERYEPTLMRYAH